MTGTKRKGFTLVELLIVIVVIGILSSMMMLSSTEATTSAKVSNIVSNMRNIKTAALAVYTDSLDVFASGTYDTDKEKFKNDMKIAIKRYLGNGVMPDFDDYAVAMAGNDGNSWYVVYGIKGSDSEKAAIKSKLKGRAKSLGLVGADNANASTAKILATTYDTNPAVAMQIK